MEHNPSSLEIPKSTSIKQKAENTFAQIIIFKVQNDILYVDTLYNPFLI